MSEFPLVRPRRLRQNAWIRDLVSETSLESSDLVWPVFVIEGKNQKQEISAMNGVCRMSIDLLVEECRKLIDLGLRAIAIFPVIDPSLKDEHGTEAFNGTNLCCRAISEVKKNFPNLGVMADVALDPYTLSGHDGIVNDEGEILNDETIEVLIKQSLCQAEAGVDIIAPSDMMDGRIIEIRKALEKNSFKNTMLMSYAAKFASNFYGPFRNAVGSDSCLKKSSKETYQMDYRNVKEAIKETNLDVLESADILMIKPAMSYLDIIYQSSQIHNIPIFAYQVSGEFAMINKMENSYGLMIESLIAIKRAGASAILSYAAPEVLKNLNK